MQIPIRIPLLPLALAALFGAFSLLGTGCGRRAAEEARDVTPEVQEHYQTFKRIPAELSQQRAAGTLTEEQYEEALAALPNFFQFATPADLPPGLNWIDNMHLPEFSSPDAIRGGTFYAAMQDFPRTFRVVGPDSNSSFRPFLHDDISMGLAQRHPNVTDIGPDGFYQFPGIAQEWAIDRNSRTVYVRIDPDARWSDGEPITSDDMLFAFFFYQSEYIRAPWYNNWYTTVYSGITRFDEHTFAVQVSELRPDFVDRVLGLNPVPQHFFRELGDDYPERYQWRVMPTSGPYTIRPDGVRMGRSITLSRVDDWWANDKKFWRNRYNPDAIRLSVIRETAKAFETFKTGELDSFGLNLAEYWYDKLPDNDPDVRAGYIEKHVFYNDVPRPTYGLWMNSSRPLLENPDIRVGIHHATNWDLVIEKFARGDWQRMRTSSDGYGEFTHPTLEPRSFSISQALESFAQAGFTRRGPDGVLVNAAGQRLSFTLSTGYESLRDILTILREEALKAGLDLRLEVLDSTAGWKKVQEKQHDIMLTAFGTGAEMFPRYWEMWHSVNAYDEPFLPDGSVNTKRQLKAQTNNLVAMAIPELDKLIEAYDRSEDVEEMKQMAYRMEEIIHEDASFVPGFIIPSYRVGLWRWIRNPDEFNVKISSGWMPYFLFWIDEDMKRETRESRRSGRTFEPVIRTYDQFKTD